jgi:hypothetical protein
LRRAMFIFFCLLGFGGLLVRRFFRGEVGT